MKKHIHLDILFHILLVWLLCLIPCHAQVTRVNSSTAYEASHVIATGIRTALWVHGYNSKGSAQFIQIHDAASVPGDLTAEVSTCNLGSRTPAQLADRYFLISSPTVDYYVWFNLDSGGSDPAIAGKTAIPVAITTGNSVATMATATAAAIDALAAFVSTSGGTSTVTITNAVSGVATDIALGTLTTGVTVTVTTQGIDSAVPLAYITVPTVSNFDFLIPSGGLPCATGIVICNSSTATTKTGGSADCFFTVTYK